MKCARVAACVFHLSLVPFVILAAIAWNNVPVGIANESLQESVHRFIMKVSFVQGYKMAEIHGDVRVAGFFGACMAQTVQTRFAGINFDWVTCVPLSRERRRERGYNQSERLAQVVASHLGLPMHADALTKIYHNEEQHRLNMQKRRANVLGVYEAKADVVQGKTILLVDDIATTGSTLEECAKVCMLEGAQAVYCVTAALVMLYQKESAVGNESVSEEHK